MGRAAEVRAAGAVVGSLITTGVPGATWAPENVTFPSVGGGGELDFSEYLPNGGWGETGPVNYQTSWNTHQLEPWASKNKSDSRLSSVDGWRNVVATVADGHVKYCADGTLVADHDHDRTGPFDVRFVDDLVGTCGGTPTTTPGTPVGCGAVLAWQREDLGRC